MDEYASILPISFCERAAKLPIVIETRAIIPKTRLHSSENGSRVNINTLNRATKPIALLAAASNAVTGVGAPS